MVGIDHRVALAIVLIVAQFKMFSIDRTLKNLLTEVRGVRRETENGFKMILLELRQDKRPIERVGMENPH